MQGGETHTAGDTKDIVGYVFDESGSTVDGIVATLTFGVAGDNNFNEASWNYSVNGFEAYTSGNGVNGRSDGGTVYIIRPNYNGYINVAVVHNANKMLYVLEDEVAMEGYNGLTVGEQYRGLYGFPVKAGSTYKIYASGSKLGFYGFNFLYTPDSSATFEAYNLTVSTNIKNNVYCNPRGTTVQTAGSTIWLDTYSYGTYRFKHWTANGEVVSTDQYFSYTMPQKDVNMVAVYEFNPTNPGDPASAENTYKLTLVSQPANAGYFSGNRPISKVGAGTSTWIYTYPNQNGYVFKEWQIDGKKISSQQEMEFTMPSQDVTLTAVYEFKPTNPGNPGTNSLVDGELMLDDFMPGGANSAAYQATSGNWDQIESIIMIGEITRWDGGDVAHNSSKCTSLDMSRTTGMNEVPSYAFKNSCLTTISLPASISEIDYDAFSSCPNLQTLNLYAIVPPRLDSLAFGDGDNSIVSQLTVFVPASSESLYKNAEVWKKLMEKGLTILPFTNEVCALEVNMPKNTDMRLYKDMYLEAYNTQSGQRLRYVLTDAISYTFSSIINNTTWNVYLKNANEEILGSILDIKMGTTSDSVSFTSLLVPQTVTLRVVAPQEENLTDKVTITWMDEKGNFLTQGAEVKNLLEGKVLKYRLTLSEALAMQYKLPADGQHVVNNEDNTIKVTLEDLPKTTISGMVTDVQSGDVLRDAIIAVSQTINGQYSKTFSVKTKDDGKWSLEVFDAPSDITASKTLYVSQTKTFETLTDVTTVETFALHGINGTRIGLEMKYISIDGVESPYADMANVTFKVADADGNELTGLSVQYPKIVMQESYEVGTKFTITAISKNNKFEPITATAEVDDNDIASATFTVKQRGGIKATFGESENRSCVGILYDANSLLVKHYSYVDNALVISELPDGKYTLVTMASSPLFNSVGQLSQFGEMGLRNGVDFVRNNITVESAKWSVVNIGRIPFLDETKLYYTSVNTTFTANKSQVTAGQYLTLRGQVDFKDVYASKVSGVKLVFNLTDDCEFVANSVMLGKNLTSYTLNGKQLIVPIGTSKDQVRFCVIPTKEGIYEPSASVCFNYQNGNQNREILQPIGSCQTTVKGVTISVPSTTANNEFTASGTATAKSEVYVYADDMLVGKTTVKANGKWSTQCVLTDPVDKSEHPVYARIVTPQQAELLTDTKTLVYDMSAILAKEVNMSFYNGWLRKTVNVNWNMIEKKVNPSSYMFYTTTDFTFTISFTMNNPDMVKDVKLIVYKNDNSYDVLTASYNSNGSQPIWVATHRYTSNALPTAVKVKYVIDDKQQILSEDKDDEGIEHSNPILDPSGYVYEAVSSNRLQGVTASIYYKEEVEDQYGDKVEKVSLWNAEDYAQVNPQFTDENGMYQWDVPNGLWQVRLEKEGYLKTNSEWLPVPPPQLDINLPMVQMKQPKVINFNASADSVYIYIEFDKYMDPATLTTENITVTRDGVPAEGTIVLLNEEEEYKDAVKTYASKIRFQVPEDKKLLRTEEILLTVNKAVESYAGVPMQEDFTQDFKPLPVIREVVVDDLINIMQGTNRTITVAVNDVEAAKDTVLIVESQSTMIAKANVSEVRLDEEGHAKLTITGVLPGSTVIIFRVEGTDVEGQMTVNVKEEPIQATSAPRASRVTGSKLYRGAKIQLSSDTEDAVIKYTLNGTSPAEAGEDVLIYKDGEPIVINDDNIVIKAIAEGKALDPSEEKVFSYELKKSTIHYQLPVGWTWISHNMENPVATSVFAGKVKRIVGQTDEIIQDSQYGFIGGLTELKPAVGYKVQANEVGGNTIEDFEFNANDHTLDIHVGWNWIGYPLNQTMTIAEALAYFDASEEDMIVSLDADAYAWFDGNQWKCSKEDFGFEPGKGYMFKSATAANIQFNTNTSSTAASRVGRRNWLIGSPWAFNKHAYPNVMPVTAEFFIDGVKCDDGQFIVAAFAGDECRGVGQWHDGRLMLNVHGDGGEKVTFMAYDKTTEQYYLVDESLTFKADNEGTWFVPMKLTLGNETTGMSEVNKDLFISVGSGYITVNAGGKNISSLTLTNMGGVTVLSASDLGTGATITTGSLSDGMYIATIKAEGKTYYEKILKGNK